MEITAVKVQFLAYVQALYQYLYHLFERVISPFVQTIERPPVLQGVPIAYQNPSRTRCWFNSFFHLLLTDRMAQQEVEIVSHHLANPTPNVEPLIRPLCEMAHMNPPQDVADVSDLLPMFDRVPGVEVRHVVGEINWTEPLRETVWLSVPRRLGEIENPTPSFAESIIPEAQWSWIPAALRRIPRVPYFNRGPIDIPLAWQQRLDAFSVHLGNDEKGHYVAYRLHGGRWLCYNDSWVSEVTAEFALQQAQQASLLHFDIRRPGNQVNLSPGSAVVANPIA